MQSNSGRHHTPLFWYLGFHGNGSCFVFLFCWHWYHASSTIVKCHTPFSVWFSENNTYCYFLWTHVRTDKSRLSLHTLSIKLLQWNSPFNFVHTQEPLRGHWIRCVYFCIKHSYKYSMKHMKQSLNALKLIQCSNKIKQY